MSRKLVATAPGRKRELIKWLRRDLELLTYDELNDIGDVLRVVLKGTSADIGVFDDAATCTEYILNRLRNADRDFVMLRLNEALAAALRGDKVPAVLADPDIQFAMRQLTRRDLIKVAALAADVGHVELGEVEMETVATSDHWAAGSAALLLDLVASREKRLREELT